MKKSTGRTPIAGASRILVLLTEEERAKARAIGGTIAQGIRIALRKTKP